jgi:NO-binding membrane sensor protein with MHYT domain
MYLPHPYLVASVLLAGFGCWAFVSVGRKAKRHPKASRPILLAVESALFGAAIFAILFGFAYYTKADAMERELAVVFGSMSVAGALSYFICPFLGYNLIWNDRMFAASAPFVLILMMLLSAYLGLKAQFQF